MLPAVAAAAKTGHAAKATRQAAEGVGGKRLTIIVGLVFLTLIAPFAFVAIGAAALFSAVNASAANQGSGLGYGLASGVVPAAYETDVLAAGRYCPEFPPAIIAAQIETESNWNPSAQNPAGPDSGQGIAQFIPSTWAVWGRDTNGDGTASVWDPHDAIDAQGRYDCGLVTTLREAGFTTNLTQLALAAYNAGPAAVIAAGGIPDIPETQAYVPKIMSLAQTYAAVAALPPASGSAAAVIAAAKAQIGQPYVWGGGDLTGPTAGLGYGPGAGMIGFDCSGLTLYSYWQGARLSLPHSARIQSTKGSYVPASAAVPGDLVYFDGGSWQHVGIYLGNGLMINNPRGGATVQIEPIHPQWTPHFVAYVRLLNG